MEASRHPRRDSDAISSMPAIDRHRLRFGPYRAPAFQYGVTVECLAHGWVTISRISDGRIPWPMTVRRSGASLILYGDLARAVQSEAACAVAYWFGVSTWMVRKWRRALGVPARNEGDRLLKREYAKGDGGKLARIAALTMAADPDRRAKISAAQRGKQRPPHVIDAIRKSMTGRKLTSEHRAKVIRFLKRRSISLTGTVSEWGPWQEEARSARSRALISRQSPSQTANDGTLPG